MKYARLMFIAVSLFAFASAAASCVTVDSADRFTIARPSLDEFSSDGVGDFLVHRCGSLDCHGQVGRNLRLYGEYGLRLDPMAIPANGFTTDAEIQEDYRSVVGLEPESMSAVVEAHGQGAANLTLLLKPLGLEEHKGGTLMTLGDDQETCITSWLSGATDKNACSAALKTP